MVDMYDSPMQGPDITLLLNRAVDGEVEAATAVWTTVHREVHAMAVNAVRNEPNANDLEASVIVSEVFLKFTGKRKEPWESRRHFFGAVARAMEQFLIDTARAMRTQNKHVAFVTESVVLLKDALRSDANGIGAAPRADALELLLLFGKLEAESPISATVLRLRYQFSMTQAQVSAALELTEEQVDHYSRFGRAFIRDRLTRGDDK